MILKSTSKLKRQPYPPNVQPIIAKSVNHTLISLDIVTTTTMPVCFIDVSSTAVMGIADLTLFSEPQVLPHEAEARTSAEAKPTYSAMDPSTDGQYDQVRDPEWCEVLQIVILYYGYSLQIPCSSSPRRHRQCRTLSSTLTKLNDTIIKPLSSSCTLDHANGFSHQIQR